MIIKKRTRPLPLQKLENVLSRLPENHRQYSYLNKETARYIRGYQGEIRFDYYIANLPNNFSILSDICLPIRGREVQFDSIVLSPQAIYIIDIKNFSHTITFNTALKQLTQFDGKEVKSYPYPITQLENLQMNFITWLNQNGLSGLPIYGFIAIAYPSTVIQVEGDDRIISKFVYHSESIPLKILKTDEQLAKQNNTNITLKQKTIDNLFKNNTDFDIDIMKKYKIDATQLLTGVHCPNCSHLAMLREHGGWICPKCGTRSKDAHEKTIKDFELLFNRQLNVRDYMYLLNIDSRYTANRLMNAYQEKNKKR